jgi:aminomethyltransferase
MTTELLRTPLHDWHVQHGGRMVDFAGWSMPVQYTSIAEEHNATRNAVGLFDISHMGRFSFYGAEAAALLDSVVTRRVTDMKPGQVRYALVCKDDGGILDDVLVYRAPAEAKPDSSPFQLVVNASNREKISDWIKPRQTNAATFRDDTLKTAMIAVQGPAAVTLAESLVSCDLPSMRYYTTTNAKFRDIPIALSRTGYTGEDGCEIICDSDQATKIWETLLSEGKSASTQAAGLGARDTLRLEAAMPLYGHELSETINPVQAGLNFAINLEGRKFIGSEALQRFAADKSQPVRIGLECDGKRVPREGCPILHNGTIVGKVTSGTFSPTLNRPIAMAYVQPSAAAIGTELTADIRGTQYPAVVVPLPFYKRTKEN